MVESIRYVALICLCFLGTLVTQKYWAYYEVDREDPPIYIPPPKYIHHFSFGYNESMSDSLWLRWVQDVDVCGAKKVARSSVLPKPSLPRNVAGGANKFREEILIPVRKNICNKGWSFRLLDAITRLTPHFRMPYAVGASTLSVLIDDHLGAKAIYERAFKYFPNDWPILYRAAYHYLYELQELDKAAELLIQAGNAGGPVWVKSLASRILTRAGQVDLGIQTLEDYILGLKHTTKSYRKDLMDRLKGLYELKGLPEDIIQQRLQKLAEKIDI